MTRTKAEFRAMRETLGMSQAMLAREVGVEVRSVKRWESTAAPQVAPQDAWDVLDEYRELQDKVVTFALGKVDEIAEQVGWYPKKVELPYWQSQQAYDENHIPEDGGDWRIANANNRLVAFALKERGVDVRWTDAPTGLRLVD